MDGQAWRFPGTSVGGPTLHRITRHSSYLKSEMQRGVLYRASPVPKPKADPGRGTGRRHPPKRGALGYRTTRLGGRDNR